MPDTVLITGFEPFGGGARNPSEAVVRAIAETRAGSSLIAEILPVEYAAAERRLQQLLWKHRPMAWLGLGLNQRATAIALERVAVNLDDASIADNSGEVRQGQTIDPVGPESYRSTLPLEEIAEDLRKLQIPLMFSESAGRFVCNHVFYRGMDTFKQANSAGIGGFVHIPWPCDWEEMPAVGHSVTLLTMIRAGQGCLTAIMRELRTQKNVAT